MAAKAKKNIKKAKETKPKAFGVTKGKVKAKAVKTAGTLRAKAAKPAPSGKSKAVPLVKNLVAETKKVATERDTRLTNFSAKILGKIAPKGPIDTASTKVSKNISEPTLPPKKAKEMLELKNIVEKNKETLAKVKDNFVKETEVATNKLKEIKVKVVKQLSTKRDQIMKKMEEKALEGLSQAARRWQLLFEKSKGIRAQVYEMSADYKADTPIQHKVLGWGYILSKKDNRIEVLFKEGIKTLITKYSP